MLSSVAGWWCQCWSKLREEHPLSSETLLGDDRVSVVMMITACFDETSCDLHTLDDWFVNHFRIPGKNKYLNTKSNKI